MSAVPRLLAAARLAAVVGASGGGVVSLHRFGDRRYFHIDWSDLGGWLAATAPEDALVAGVRVLALGVAWWVLGTTLLYAVARATRLPGALRAVEWATLPAVRRLADRAVAVTLAGSSVLGAAAPAVAADRDPPAVMPTAVVLQVDELDDEGGGGTAESGTYVPVPAGEDPPRVGQASPPGEPGFRLPLPEAPAAVSPPPVTALPPESEAGEQNGEVTVPLEAGVGAGDAATSRPPGDEAALDAASRRAQAGAGPSPGAAAGEPTGDDDPATSAAADERRSEAEREQPASLGTYTVAPGDHLWGIAERALAAALGGPPSPGETLGYWRQLVAANTGRLASGDPDLIFPAEVIDLPAISTREE